MARTGNVTPNRRPPASPARRRRRPVETARAEILDAAERLLAEGGPEAIRLKEIAAAVGLSHPTVLHHFGSRQELVEALVERAMRVLTNDLTEALRAPDVVASGPEILERVFHTLGDAGHARLLVWRVLAGWTRPEGATEGKLLRQIIDVVHERRRDLQRGDPEPDPIDTAFTILLAAFATVGEAVLGPLLLPEAAGKSRTIGPRYRRWLADRVVEILMRPGASATDKGRKH